MHYTAQNPKPCLDLCELVCLCSGAPQTEQRIQDFLHRDAFDGCERIYVGSSFCPQALFASKPLIEAAACVCRSADMHLTLVLPIFAQRFLEKGRAYVAAALSEQSLCIDEVVVNDFGMLAYMANAIEAGQVGPVKIHLGRLLAKDTRDVREPEFFAQPYAPNLLQQSESGSILSRYTASLEGGAHIAGIELDLAHETLDLSEAPESLIVSVHEPQCYMSTGQICEFASIGKAPQASFRPNDTCSLQCLKNCERYEGASGKEFFKIGRTVYFNTKQPRFEGGMPSRRLISVLEEVMG